MTEDTHNNAAAEGEAPDTRALVSKADGGLVQASTEELPVLEAFQHFLETERRQSRKRMIIMAACFSAALVIVVVAGIAYGLSIIQPVQEDFTSLRSSVHMSERERERTENRLNSAIDRLSREERFIKEALSGGRQAIAETRSDLAIKSESLETQLDATRKLLDELNIQNQQLRDQLAEVTEEVPVLALEMKTVLEKIHEQRPGPGRPPASGAPSEQPVPHTPRMLSRRGDTLEMSILPAGGSEPFPWRLPIPE